MARFFENFNSARYPNPYMGYSMIGSLAVEAVRSAVSYCTIRLAAQRGVAMFTEASQGLQLAVDTAIPSAVERQIIELYEE